MMNPKIFLSLAIHNHQPVGNFGWVFEEAFEKAYLPMIECLERHSAVRVALHYSGPLRDWMLENRGDFLPRVRQLVAKGQVEIMTGAYYEAVLISLSDLDKAGQIGKLTDAVRSDFGYEATGLWLAERIWEPHLPLSLSNAGIEYTIVDDAHFKAAGYTDDDLFGYYVTEEQGRSLKVLATSMWLRYGIPWKPVGEVIDWLNQQRIAEDQTGRYVGRQKVAVMGDDGEKFGLWPGTYEHIWKNGWMDRFFDALEQNSEFIETIVPGDFVRQYTGLGRIYLPTASYDEMGEWAMPPDAAWQLPTLKHELEREGNHEILKYLRGGLWRNFMVKYPEVNQLHKKSLWVSRKVHEMKEGKNKRAALDHLWAGQCNCAYWHGVFGGIYLFHIRETDYRHLITAENMADGLEGSARQQLAKADTIDFDVDGLPDVVLTTDRQCLTFDLDQGGSLVEWDFRPAHYNLLNVLTRRREGYHKTLLDAAAADLVETPDTASHEGEPETIHTTKVRAREHGLEQKLIYDWHRRASFLDHFFDSNVTLDDYYRVTYRERGDFVNQPYDVEIRDAGQRTVMASLFRDGQVQREAAAVPVRIEKTIEVPSGEDSLRANYQITNHGESNLEISFGIETNWGFAGINEQQNALRVGGSPNSLADILSIGGVDYLSLSSELWGVEVHAQMTSPATVWSFPLETVSASEGGFERNYQGTTILLWWPLILRPGEQWGVKAEFLLKATRQ